jgi:hypothetical protein
MKEQLKKANEVLEKIETVERLMPWLEKAGFIAIDSLRGIGEHELLLQVKQAKGGNLEPVEVLVLKDLLTRAENFKTGKSSAKKALVKQKGKGDSEWGLDLS